MAATKNDFPEYDKLLITQLVCMELSTLVACGRNMTSACKRIKCWMHITEEFNKLCTGQKRETIWLQDFWDEVREDCTNFFFSVAKEIVAAGEFESTFFLSQCSLFFFIG